jgi:helicase MOV-10
MTLQNTNKQLASWPSSLVAVTRAQALLIVVGDPNVLGLDPLWRSFLNYVHRNGGWTGLCDIPWDSAEEVDDDREYDAVAREAALRDMNEFTRRMEAMTLGGMAEDGEVAEANADRPWREDEWSLQAMLAAKRYIAAIVQYVDVICYARAE